MTTDFENRISEKLIITTFDDVDAVVFEIEGGCDSRFQEVEIDEDEAKKIIALLQNSFPNLS